LIPFWFIWPAVTLATFIPVYLAIIIVSRLRWVPLKYLAAAGVGLTFWFFFDTMGDAGSLGENNAIYPASLFGGLPHFALIGSFVAGVAALAIFDYVAIPSPSSSRKAMASYMLVPTAVAMIMGIHGLGEGWDAVSGVSTGTATVLTGLPALIQAYGTFPAVVSYPIHKFLEGSIVGIVYAAFSLRPRGWKGNWWEIGLLGLCFAGPSAVGAAVGYYVSFDTTYFYAFGVTSALYAMIRLGEALSKSSDSATAGWTPTYLGSKAFAALAIGFLLLYTAALLH
jgi:hypothetical protein